MFCYKCGTRLTAESEFCHKCGTRRVEAPAEDRAAGDDPSRGRLTPSPIRSSDEAGEPTQLDHKLGSGSEVAGPAAAAVVSQEDTGADSAQGVSVGRPHSGSAEEEGDSYWISYSDVFLKSSSDDRSREDLAVLARGTQVTVVERGPSGKVRVVTEDGTEGWVNAVVLSRRFAEREASAPQKATSRRCTICGRSLGPREMREGWTVHQGCLTREAGFVPDDERASAARRYVRSDDPPASAPSPYRPASTSDAGLLGRIVFLLGGVGILISPFLPWIHVQYDQSYNLSDLSKGAEALGEVLAIGIIALIGGFVRALRIIDVAWARVWGIIVGGLGLAEIAYQATQIHDKLRGEDYSWQFGVFLLPIAAVMVIAGVLVDRD